jgi:hypothetical protein
MHTNSLRLTASGLVTAALLLASGTVQANAASTQGRQTIVYDNCVTDEEAGLVSCISGSERSIHVRTPSGRVIIQSNNQYQSTTTHRGDTTTDKGGFRSVNVFEWYVDGLNFEARVIKVAGSSTMTFPDGMTCDFETDFVSVREQTKFDHGSVTCTTP